MTDARDIVERCKHGVRWPHPCDDCHEEDMKPHNLIARIETQENTIASLRKQLDDARSEALEEAAKACEGQKYTQEGVDASFRDGDGRPSDHNETCDELADVIRALKGNS